MDRRAFISQSAAGALLAGLGVARPVYAEPIRPGRPLADYRRGRGMIGWDEFLDRAVNAANGLKDDRSQPGQDAYLYTLGSIASRLAELPEVNPRDFGNLNPAYKLNLIFRDAGSPFIVLYWQMEPGAVFPAHCHPGANVCTLCTSGRAIIRNYDTVAGSPDCWETGDESFGVVETKREVLRPGVVNPVSEFRNNIHRFEAGPEGVEGIDITTGYDEEPKPFSYLALTNPRTGTAGEPVFDGRWVGKDIKRAV